MKFLAKTFVTITLITTYCTSVYGQGDTTEVTYIRPFTEYFYLKVISSTKIFSIKFKDIQSDASVREYKPSDGSFFGFGAYAFDLGLEVSFRLPTNTEGAEEYTESSAIDWQAHLLGRRFGLDFAYQDYTGFYLQDPEKYYKTNAEDRAFRSDMKVNSLSFNLLYVFSPDNFSFPAVFNHSEQQVRSAGSFLLSGMATFSNLSADSSFILLTDSNNFLNNIGISHITNNTYGVLVGYAYNIIIKRNIYIALSGAIGPAYQKSTVTDRIEVQDINRLALARDWRIGIGYSNPTFFAGFSIYYAQNDNTLNQIRLSTNSGFFKMFFGYRIREWGVLKKSIFDLLPFLQSKYHAGSGYYVD